MTQAQDRTDPMVPPPRRTTVSGRYLVLGVLGLGLVAFALVIIFVVRGINRPPEMDAVPVGAGAGETGMYNQHMGKQREALPPPPPQADPTPAPAGR